MTSTYSFFVIDWRGKAKWFKTAGVYYMIVKVQALREEIGDGLYMNSVNQNTNKLQETMKWSEIGRGSV